MNKTETLKTLKGKFDEFMKKNYYKKDKYGCYGIEIYCDYHNELDDSTVKKICSAEDPMMELENILNEYVWDYEPELRTDLYHDFEMSLNECDEEILAECEDEFYEYLLEEVYWYYPINHFDKDIHVTIKVNSGNMNYDFACDNILNYCGNCTIDENSSILWLAKQQGKEKEFRYAIKDYSEEIYYDHKKVDKEKKFVVSLIDELREANSHMNTLTFLLRMSMFDFFELKKKIENKEKKFDRYYPQRTICDDYIILDKHTHCGLLDAYQGSCSQLNIVLDEDVVLPLKNIFAIEADDVPEYGYGIDDICGGIIEEWWQGNIKEIHIEEDETMKEVV